MRAPPTPSRTSALDKGRKPLESWIFPDPKEFPLLPLPESMRFLGSGWWGLHIVSGVALFCLGWFVGQNRAERHYLKLKQEREQAGQEQDL